MLSTAAKLPGQCGHAARTVGISGHVVAASPRAAPVGLDQR
jgi:hypothetical protein